MAKKKPTLVQIEWRDPASDWPWFWLLSMRGEWLHLQGADFPDGSAKHDGDCFWVHKSDVRTMRSNDRVEGRDAALSRRVPSHDGLGGADLRRKT